MKHKNMRDLDSGEIQSQLTEMEAQMFRLKFQMSMGQNDGLKKVRNMRKDRARMLTTLREREIEKAAK